MGGYTALCCILFKWFVNKRMLLAQDICSSKSIATIVVKIFVVSTTYCTYFCVLSGFCLFFWKKGELACKLQIPLFNRHWEGSHICPFKHRLYCTTLLYLLVQYIKRQRLSRWNTFLKLKALLVILSFHILFNLNHTTDHYNVPDNRGYLHVFVKDFTWPGTTFFPGSSPTHHLVNEAELRTPT